MQLNITLLSIVLVIIAIWVLLETKRFKHKMVAIFIIIVILFTYFSFSVALSGKKLDLSTVDGISQAGAVYFSWLGSVFTNVKTITANAVKMNWGVVNENTTFNETLYPTNSSG
jgi:hypothetical protein